MTRLMCLRQIAGGEEPGGGAGPLPRVLVIGAALFCALLSWSPWGLWEPDEGRYANVAQTMLDRGDFVTPRIDGVVFLDKPPLVYWVTAASMAVWGKNEFGARFGQALFAAGLLAIAFEIAWQLYGDRRAAIALVILGSTVGFFTAGHYLNLDLGLAFFVALTMLCFLRGHRAGPGGTRWYLGMFAAAAGGVLAKGPVAVALVGMAAAAFLVVRGGLATLRHVPWVRGLLIFLALAAPWFVAVSVANPVFPSYFFLHENLARFATTVHHRSGAWYYYLVLGAFGLMPWTPALLVGLARWRPGPEGWLRRLRGEAPAFLLAWAVPTFVFFSMSRSKLPGYILPAFPAVAVAAAPLLDGLLRAATRLRTVFLWPIATPLCFLAVFAAYWQRHHREWHDALGGTQMAWLVALATVVAAAAQAAGWLVARRGRVLGGVAVTALAWSLAWYLALLGTGRAGAFNATRELAMALRARGWSGEPVYTYQCELRGLPFYLGTTVGIVSSHDDDTEIGRQHGHDPGSFPSREEFAAGLRGGTPVFVLLRTDDLPSLQTVAGGPLHTLASTARYSLVSNRPARGRD